jgi:hypothetical protein
MQLPYRGNNGSIILVPGTAACKKAYSRGAAARLSPMQTRLRPSSCTVAVGALRQVPRVTLSCTHWTRLSRSSSWQGERSGAATAAGSRAKGHTTEGHRLRQPSAAAHGGLCPAADAVMHCAAPGPMQHSCCRHCILAFICLAQYLCTKYMVPCSIPAAGIVYWPSLALRNTCAPSTCGR